MLERVFGLFFLVGGASVLLSAAMDREIGGLIIAGAVTATGVGHTFGALRHRIVLSADGWHRQAAVVSWSEIQAIHLERSSRRGAGAVVSADGSDEPIANFLPNPWLAPRVGRSIVDLLCHLQHDVAHELGVAPVPVVVDMGQKEPRVGFVHPCRICGT